MTCRCMLMRLVNWFIFRLCQFTCYSFTCSYSTLQGALEKPILHFNKARWTQMFRCVLPRTTTTWEKLSEKCQRARRKPPNINLCCELTMRGTRPILADRSRPLHGNVYMEKKLVAHSDKQDERRSGSSAAIRQRNLLTISSHFMRPISSLNLKVINI